MKMKKHILAALCSTAVLGAAAMLPVSGAWVADGYLGDLNCDGDVTVADIVQLQHYLLGQQTLDAAAASRAEMTGDGKVNILDLVLLKRCVLTGMRADHYVWQEETPTEPPTDPVTEEPTQPITEPPTEPATEEPTQSVHPYITNSIAEVNASLPSHGKANLVIFYVDFPDCRYDVDPEVDVIESIAFGGPHVNEDLYPFESMAAFYSRSSKGAMQLGGRAFRYTTKENQAAYDTNKVKLAEECYEAFKDSVDFSQFDGDGDGMIDATLFTVPTAAGDTDWWPCAGGFGDPDYRVDGAAIGHIITGNAQIQQDSYKNFVSSYLHEMGHCMGLPDYYLYTSADSEGMHGNAGTELMDSDAYSDFGCFSKLMLGWYREDQVQVYDPSNGSQTFRLQNAQSENGNCVILPYGEMQDGYFSEYMMIEYITEDGNNSAVNKDISWWQSVKSGIRVYHIQAELQRDYWYTYLKYQNGSEYCGGDDEGIRLIRLANDAEGGSVFTSGDIIDGSISGFHWYDENENESIETGYRIEVGELLDGVYSIAVSRN